VRNFRVPDKMAKAEDRIDRIDKMNRIKSGRD
jgi:hypothetical protein